MNKIIISTALLLEGLEPLFSIIRDKNIIPVRECVKIEVEKKAVRFSGDNGEISCIKSLDFQTNKPFSFCVRFSTFAKMVKSLSKQEVEIEVGPKLLKVTHKKGDFSLPVVDSKDFPKTKKEELSLKANLEGDALKNSLKVANKFILNSDLEPMANVSLQIGADITVRSTNKSCLFQEIIEGSGDETALLLSGAASNVLCSLLPNEKIEVKYNNNIVHFKTETFEMVILLQNGDYPLAMFNKVISSLDDAIPLKVDSQDFLASIKRTSLLSDNEYYNLVKLDVSKKEVKISCDNKSMSTASIETLKAKCKDEKIVGFDSRILIEILSVFSEDVDLSFNSMNGICFSCEGKKGMLAPVGLQK